MNDDAARRVRESWALAEPEADTLADRFYTALFAASPETAKRFAGVDLAAQRRKFLESIATLIRALDEPHDFVQASIASGRRHAAHDITSGEYDLVGDVLLETLGGMLGEGFDADTRLAWRELYALVAALMQRSNRNTPPRGQVSTPELSSAPVPRDAPGVGY